MAKRHPPSKLMADLGAAAIDASITLWWRWPILLSAGLPSKDRAELNRMVTEKAGAAAAGMIAAQTEMVRITARAFTACIHDNHGCGFETSTPHCQGKCQPPAQEALEEVDGTRPTQGALAPAFLEPARKRYSEDLKSLRNGNQPVGFFHGRSVAKVRTEQDSRCVTK